MKKITLLLFTSILATIGYSQQFPLQSQYQFNYSLSNPASVGENDFYSVRASFRSQWLGFTNKPIATQFFTLTKGIGNNGLGISFMSDKTGGGYNKTGMAVSYSHKVSFTSSDLFFGISAGGSQMNLDLNTEDPVVLSNNDFVPEVIFGAYYKIKDFKIGISVPGLLSSNMEFSDSKDNIYETNFCTMLSYQKKLNHQWSVFPSILWKAAPTTSQLDANINFKLRNKIWIGTSYRTDYGPSVYVGIDFGRLFSVYSNDFSTGVMADHSNGSHEFTIGYDFIPLDEIEKERREREKEREFENDKDKDGIEDKSDMCPDEYGEAIANGCPDSDKDGIPDKYDLCPNLFGTKELQGCPDLTDHEKEILSMALGNLKFNFDSDVIKSFSYKTLTKLTALLLSNPTMNISIEGHASSEGSENYNMDLSAARVKSVQKFFVSKGVDKGRISMDWEGESVPLNTNSNETERAENRRVEFDIKHHSYDNSTVLKIKEEYLFLLNKITADVSLEEPVLPQATPSSVDKEKEIESTEKQESAVEVLIEKESSKDDNQQQELTEQDAVIEEIIEEEEAEVEAETEIEAEAEAEAEDSTIIIDSIIKDSPSNNTEEEIEESNVAGSNDYILVVFVSSFLENTKDFIERSEESLDYIEDNGKFYVYIYSNANREYVEQFRSVYKKDCWIKNP